MRLLYLPERREIDFLERLKSLRIIKIIYAIGSEENWKSSGARSFHFLPNKL
jgi:hypothetical protein